MRESLKQYRCERRFTQSQIAEQIGIGVEMYRNMEAGRRTGNIALWISLSEIFNAPIALLLSTEQQQKTPAPSDQR